MPESVSRRSSAVAIAAIVRGTSLREERPLHHHGAPFRRGHVAELLVQATHRLVPFLALRDESPEAGGLRGGDLGALQRAGDAAPAPVAARRRQPVVCLVAEDL